MTTSTRFPVAIHILVLIAVQQGTPVPSELIADSVNSHASVVRRILAALNKAKITDAQMGSGGGAVLAKPAKDITLLEVYRAVEDQDLFAFHRSGPNLDCMIGRSILPVVSAELEKVTQAFEDKLSEIQLASIVSGVLERGKLAGGLFLRL